MEQIIKKHRQDILLIGLILVLAIGTFVFFKTFFDSNPTNLTVEILAAMLGSIITVMITMLLIKRQGTIEQAHEAAATSKTIVFEKKLELFRRFIETYARFAADGVLDEKEKQECEVLVLTISLFTNEYPENGRMTDLGEELCHFVLQLEVFGLQTELREEDHALYDQHFPRKDPSQPRRLLTLVDILRGMKAELGVAQVADDVEDQGVMEKDYHWATALMNYRERRSIDSIQKADFKGL